MGLFDGLFMAVDLVKSGIDSYKTTEHLQKLAEQASEFYQDSFTDENKKLYAEYKKAEKAVEDNFDMDKSAELSEEVDKTVIAFLLSVSTNPVVSKKFKDEVKETVAEWKRVNEDAAYDIIEKYALKMAKTDEEKAEVRKMMDEIAAEE